MHQVRAYTSLPRAKEMRVKHMAINEELRPSNRPARAGGLRVHVRAVLALVALLAVFLAGAALRREAPQVEFLQEALGKSAASAPLTRRPDEQTRVELHPGGYTLERGPVSVGLRSTVAADTDLSAFANGASRRTPYGWEAVTVGRAKTEQFLTVVERQGSKTWRWELETLDLTPRVGDDGAVGFIRGGRLLSDVAFIEPVRILDGAGGDVTPADARWSVAQSGGRWYLELPLDDSALPIPYVIDPAISNRSVGVSTPNAAAATEVVPVPAGVVAGDVLVAQLTMRNNTTITGVTGQPSGGGAFTSIDRRVTTGTVMAQEVFYRVATASEPTTSYTFALSASVKASAGIAAYVDGANQANPINVSNGQANNTASTTVAAPTVTTTVADTRLLTLVGAATGNASTTNWTGLTNERWDTSSTAAGANTRTSTGLGDEAFVGPGVTPARSGTNVSSAVSVGQTVAIAPLAADGSGTLTTPTSSVSSQSAGNTITFTYTVATGGMRAGSVTLVAPAGWTAPSTTGRERRVHDRLVRHGRSGGPDDHRLESDAHSRIDLHDHLRLDGERRARRDRSGPGRCSDLAGAAALLRDERRARQPRRLSLDHDQPGSSRPDRAHRLDREPDLRRDPRPHRHDPGRVREHRHLRQLDRRHVLEAVGRGHRDRHRHRDRRPRESRRRRSQVRSSARSRCRRRRAV